MPVVEFELEDDVSDAEAERLMQESYEDGDDIAENGESFQVAENDLFLAGLAGIEVSLYTFG